MKTFLIILLMTAAGFCSLQSHLQAQEKPPAAMMKSSSQWGWTKEKWVKSEIPFLRLREQIDKELDYSATKEKILKIYQKHALQSQKKPRNAQAAFAWIYAGYRAQQLNPQFDRKLLSQVRMALLLGRHSFDNSEWARLRFLFECQPSPRPPLKSVGERLVAKYPKDTEIKYQLARALSPANPNEKQKALKYAQDLIRLEPKRPNYHALLGGIYFKSWLTHKTKADADQAVKAYTQFLQLAPAAHPFRSQAKRTIELLKRS